MFNVSIPPRSSENNASVTNIDQGRIKAFKSLIYQSSLETILQLYFFLSSPALRYLCPSRKYKSPKRTKCFLSGFTVGRKCVTILALSLRIYIFIILFNTSLLDKEFKEKLLQMLYLSEIKLDKLKLVKI